MYQKLKDAVRRLAAMNFDNATRRNQIGFMKCHSTFGNWLAQQSVWKLKWALKIYGYLRVYQNTQVPEYPEIPNPSLEGDEMSMNSTFFWCDLETLDWEEFREVKKLGKWVRNAPLPADQNAWYAFYKTNKGALNAKGYSMAPPSKYCPTWQISHWVSENPMEPSVEKPVVPIETPSIPSIDLTQFNLNPLYEYQKGHVGHLIQTMHEKRVTLDGSDTGTGKTICALVLCRELHLKPLIICPKPVIPGWYRNLALAGMEKKDILGVVNYDLLRTGKMLTPRINKKKRTVYDKVACEYLTVSANSDTSQYASKYMMKWHLPEDAILIFDEAHRCKNKDTQNTQLMTAAVDAKARILMLSATIGESPLKMFGVAKAFGFYNHPAEFYTWIQDYGCHKEKVSRNATAWKSSNNPVYMEKLHHVIYPAFGSRLRVKELIANGLFPESQILAECFSLNGDTEKLNQIYEEMEEELAELNRKKENVGDNQLAIRQKAAQRAELLKVPMLCELAQDHLDDEKSVAIFVNYTQTLTAICEKLKTDCTIYGQNSAAINEANRLRFEKNEARIIVCNIAAAREGIDLHDKYQQYPRVSLIMPNDSAQYLKQVFGRVHRAGGTASTQYLVFAAQTIEERICENVRHKLNNIQALNDGDLQIDYLMGSFHAPQTP